MFEQLFSSKSACCRHRAAPFPDERERYLRHCARRRRDRRDAADEGQRASAVCPELESNARDGVDMADLKALVRKRQTRPLLAMGVPS